MNEIEAPHEEGLCARVTRIIEEARSQAARSVNTAMVHAYWSIGREIIEVEQTGSERAEYGEQVLERLSKRLSRRFGKGFGVTTLQRVRAFFLTYPLGSALPSEDGGGDKRSAVLAKSAEGPIRSTLLTELAEGPIYATPLHESAEGPARPFPPSLSWSHYLALMRVEDPSARAFYEIEAAREAWSVRELQRQIASLLFQRLARSRDKREVLKLALRPTCSRSSVERPGQPRTPLRAPSRTCFASGPHRRCFRS